MVGRVLDAVSSREMTMVTRISTMLETYGSLRAAIPSFFMHEIGVAHSIPRRAAAPCGESVCCLGVTPPP